MEKSEEAYSGKPPSMAAYLEFGRPNHLDTIINEVGAGFSAGTVLGFFGYLLKDRQGVRSAIAKSRRFGGMCALFNLCAEVGLLAHYKLRGGSGSYKADNRHELVARTIAGGLVFVPPGRLFYPPYALASGAINSLLDFYEVHRTRTTSHLRQICIYENPDYNSMPKIS